MYSQVVFIYRQVVFIYRWSLYTGSLYNRFDCICNLLQVLGGKNQELGGTEGGGSTPPGG